VKTRLIGDLTAAQAAELHAAFLADLLDRLSGGGFELRLAWALDEGEEIPDGDHPGVRQRGPGLGDRLFTALSEAAGDPSLGGMGSEPLVAALGSDHPTLPLEVIHRAFEALEAGAPVVIGPAEDGGYYLIAVRAEALSPRLFADIAWSTPQVLAATLERCRELGLTPEMLPLASDVDTPDDLRRLAARMTAAGDGDLGCPRTRELLQSWGRIPAVPQDAGGA
jgi:rSAM/selenodomain-associated transferase 1